MQKFSWQSTLAGWRLVTHSHVPSSPHKGISFEFCNKLSLILTFPCVSQNNEICFLTDDQYVTFSILLRQITKAHLVTKGHTGDENGELCWAGDVVACESLWFPDSVDSVTIEHELILAIHQANHQRQPENVDRLHPSSIFFSQIKTSCCRSKSAIVTETLMINEKMKQSKSGHKVQLILLTVLA